MHLRSSIVILAALGALAGGVARAEAPADRWSVGTSAWQLANLFADPPQFYFLEINRRLDARHAIVVEALTWRYHAPIGIPYGDSHGDPAEDYPGSVRSVGLGLGWRYELYRGLNASARAFQLAQRYSEDDEPTRTGYQLFLQARLGWRLGPRAPGFWIEPSIGFNA